MSGTGWRWIGRTVPASVLALVLVSWIGFSPSPVHAQSAELMNAVQQFETLHKQGRFDEAEGFARKALELGKREFGTRHEIMGALVNNLAGLHRLQGRYADAEPLYGRSLAIMEKALGSEHSDVALVLNDLADLYTAQGRYADADPLYKRSLAIYEKALGPENPLVARTLNNLAMLYRHQGRYSDAEPLYKHTLEIYEKVLGRGHPWVATTLNNLAGLYQDQGRYGDAEPLFNRSLMIRKEALGPEHLDVGQSLNNLAGLYQDQGRYRDAEHLFKLSLAIWEKALDPEHPDVATTINNLAAVYENQGRFGDAEPLYRHSLAIREKVLGPEHPNVGVSLNNLAGLYRTQGRDADAEPLFNRALAIYEKALGPEHPSVGQSLNNLASLYWAQGHYADAEPMYRRSLAISEKALGPEHPSVATTLNNLAALNVAQGLYADADPLYKRSLAISETALGPEHPNVAKALSNLAMLYWAQGQSRTALEYIRRATTIHRDRAVGSAAQRSRGGISEQKSDRPVFATHVEIAWNIARREPIQHLDLIGEAFEASQLARATSTAAAVSSMGARFGAGTDAVAGLVRELQDGVEAWRRLDEALIKAVGQPPDKRNSARETRLRGKLKKLDGRLKELRARLRRDFPEYAELVSASPVAISGIQSLLHPDEAMIAHLVGKDASYIWILRSDRVDFQRVELGAKDLDAAVGKLRAALDPAQFKGGSVPDFPVDTAYGLYQSLFAPVEQLLQGVRHLFVVPDGALQSVPPGVLLIDKTMPLKSFAGYGQAPWLARRYAISVLPSVTSLRALRSNAKASAAQKPFVGFGDPLVQGKPEALRKLKARGVFGSDGIADVETLRRGISPLPETADELRSIATSLGSGNSSVYLGERATESTVKRLDLSNYHTVAFATHALVAGELADLGEPSLVLTPPKRGTSTDDGLLTASEVALLQLDADWVVLSACNTAAPDGAPGADALSGLAKAFFYAGARSLLVSHWPVYSDAGKRLVSRTLALSAGGVGRAEALRRAMLELMSDNETPDYAHPLFWAPFVVVGEGASRTRMPAPYTPAVSAKRTTVSTIGQEDSTAEQRYWVQLESGRDVVLAKKAMRSQVAKHPDILDGVPTRIVRVDLGNRGVWYRLQVGGFASEAKARKLADALKQRGVDSPYVTKN